jgi:thiol-disulfide isomerase/thioredoxin
MTTKSNFIYKLIIKKESDFPVEVMQVNDLNSDFIKTSFTNVQADASALPELSWYYSTYTNDFKPATEKTSTQLLSRGSSAPGWKLQVYNKKETLSLDDLKGKVILLDFWIKNCGPCIESVPHLNQLEHKFRNKNFKLISINSYDSRENVSLFCNKHNTEYTVLLNGKNVAEKYGVDGFPAFFIIDKEGKIIYANMGYSTSLQSEIEQIIQQAL